MKFIKVMLLWAIPHFCTKKCIRVPHRVPNFRKLCGKLAFLRFLSPFRAFSRISRRASNTLGGPCYIHLTTGARLIFSCFIAFSNISSIQALYRNTTDLLYHILLHIASILKIFFYFFKKTIYICIYIWYTILVI